MAKPATPDEKSNPPEANHLKYPGVAKPDGGESKPRVSLNQARIQKAREEHLKKFWRGGKT